MGFNSGFKGLNLQNELTDRPRTKKNWTAEGFWGSRNKTSSLQTNWHNGMGSNPNRPTNATQRVQAQTKRFLNSRHAAENNMSGSTKWGHQMLTNPVSWLELTTCTTSSEGLDVNMETAAGRSTDSLPYIRNSEWISTRYPVISKSIPLYRNWGSVQAVRPIGGVEV